MITVRANKYDGSANRSWSAELIRHEGSLVVLEASFAEEVQHPLLGTISRGTLSTEYYWLDRWYNIFRFHKASGQLRNYYCNINLPPTFDGEILSYVDLDIDLLVNEDMSYIMLDEDEFERNAIEYSYSLDVREQAHRAVNELKQLIENREFPFDQ